MIALIVILLVIGVLAAAVIVFIGGISEDSDPLTIAAIAVLGRISQLALILAVIVAVINTFLVPVLSLFGPVVA